MASVNGTVTFCFEGSESEVQEWTEGIIQAVWELYPDHNFHVSEDTWDEDTKEQE